MGIWTWRVVSYTLTHLSLRGKSSLKCNMFYCKNIFFSLWAKHGHSEKRKCRPVMMMKEKKERKKMLEKKNLFRLFRPWHIASVYSCHAGFAFKALLYCCFWPFPFWTFCIYLFLFAHSFVYTIFFEQTTIAQF